jgi:hypothetical protein
MAVPTGRYSNSEESHFSILARQLSSPEFLNVLHSLVK